MSKIIKKCIKFYVAQIIRILEYFDDYVTADGVLERFIVFPLVLGLIMPILLYYAVTRVSVGAAFERIKQISDEICGDCDCSDCKKLNTKNFNWIKEGF